MHQHDSTRFVQSMKDFNSIVRIRSIYEKSFVKEERQVIPLVRVIAFCLNPNHFHMILEQLEENGISKYFHSLLGGYTKYFNNKYKRRGSLLQGPFKAKHINNNDYLLHASAYVNLNDKVHQLGTSGSKLVRSSWEEYQKGEFNICEPSIILDQFTDHKGYQKYALDTLPSMLEIRPAYEDLKHLEP